jgi:dynamin 1-like protein
MQSAGKSSLLESIVGYDFLPRGEGLVTRRPLEMRLVHLNDEDAEPYAVFDVQRDKKYTDFKKVTQKIVSLTDEVAGTNKGIVNDPITMTVYANSCPDLTLIDLPGITKVPLRGSSQGKDIEEVTKGMCKYYCEQARTIILCVCQANVDLSTSDGLKMALELDEDGERTIGVLTKVDIMNSGTDAVPILRNEEVPLKYGYVAVKGRSQKDIDSGMTIAEGLEAEKEWFMEHDVYGEMSDGDECLGTEALVNKLSVIMNRHIKKNLPVIVEEIENKLNSCDNRLNELGIPLPVGNSARMQVVWRLLNEYTTAFKNTILGKYSKVKRDDEPTGAQMRLYFMNIFSEYFKDKDDLTYYLRDKHIEKAFMNYEGDSFPGFPSYGGFLSLLHPFIDKLYSPCGEIVDNVYYNLDNTSRKIIETVFGRFPGLEELVTDLAGQVLANGRDKAKKMVHNLLDSERGYVFTSDPEFIQEFGGLLPVSFCLTLSQALTSRTRRRPRNGSSRKSEEDSTAT